MRMQVQSLALLSGLGSSITASLGLSCRWDLVPELLRLWHRLAAAAPIQPLAREILYAASGAIKRNKKKKVEEKH